MKILLVHPGMSYYGGAELVVVKLAHHLKEKGHNITVLTLSASEEIRKDLYGISVLNEGKMFDSGLFGIIGQIDVLNMNIRDIESEFDIINVHNFPAELAMRKIKTPSVWYCNEPPTYWLNPKARFQSPHKLLLKHENRIVKKYINKTCVADEFNVQRFKERYNITPEIVPYGIDYNFFSHGNPIEAIEKHNLKDKFVILQVGMITPQKNQIRSIQAVENLKNKIPSIKLILSGNNSSYYALQLNHYVITHKLTKHIIFTRNMNRKKLRNLYHACNVLVHPVKSQGGWLVPFECMCAGKPIIISPEFTGSNIISNNGLGMVTNNLENAILSTYNNNYKTEQSIGKKWIKENLSWEKFGDGMLEVFEKVNKE